MILNEIQRFLYTLFNSIDDDLIFLVGIGFQILITIFFIIKSHYSYEMRVVKKLVRINSWLNENQYIDSNNLLAFNDLMKKTPKLLRYYWHQYMLYREKDPSFYMSPYNCIEKPLKTSSFRTNIKNYTLLSMILAFGIFIFSIAGLGTVEFQFLYLTKTLYVPIAIILLNMIFVIILRARENRNLSALYQYFHYFNRFLDKAVTTMPPYVDFEVLFTRKEIQKGIPVLNEYLEKRARQEQEELEKARLYAVEHETYDFSEAGLNGSLVLDRAMKEAETYINIRQRLLSEIEQFESESDSLKRNYENTQKEYEKRMQASKENIIRLKTQQEESTSRIETNYIKKQQLDEIKKQEQLERDHESATVRFNQEMEVLIAEIDTRKSDLEQKRLYVEDAMKAEYQTFSLKLYNNITNMIEEKNQQEKESLIAMKDEIAEQLDQATICLSDKDREIQDLRNLLKSHKIKIGGYAGFHSEKLQAEAKRLRRGDRKLKSKQDLKLEIGEINTEILDSNKKKDDTDDDNEKKKFADLEKNNIIKDSVSEIEKQTDTKSATVSHKIVNKKDSEQIESGIKSEQEEQIGYYDDKGNYCYKTGAYYDAEGIYHDEHGGWYDKDLNYHTKQSDSVGEGLEFPHIKNEQPQAKTQIEEIQNRSDDINSKIFDDEVEKYKKQTTKSEFQKEISDDVLKNDLDDFETEQFDIDFSKDDIEQEVDNKSETIIEEKDNEKVSRIVAEIPEVTENFNDIGKTTSESKQGLAYEKQKEEETQAETPQIETSQTETPQVEIPQTETPQTETSKRGPGRPRKKVSENSAEPKVKRGPGRPRKIVDVDAEPKVKRKPGRPRKNPEPVSVSEATVLKSQSESDEDKLKNSEEIELLNQKIANENEKLKKQQEELKNQLDEALFIFDENSENDD